ncbi:hypothetical protein [Halorubrum cibi]|uniref:Uncharacterized protein n=1 Tax=Halorubrum cibi TaxID=413815 RepID=A0A521BKG3_9EURY|nr:hypothetical protein [Halorubrum cibi]SMO47613.1 hypothetical protein SAMN06264867_102311 [Halorubrum cibi]
MTDEDVDDASEGRAVDHADDVGGTRLARRWRALDRGWQALCLGLAIVFVHLVIYPV